MLLEDCLNEIKKEIENVQNEIGNIEELDSINQHIEEIKTTLQEIDSEINNLNENYVPESRTIAGINLENDIKASSLGAKLTA
jgi:archaellum component FlaC